MHFSLSVVLTTDMLPGNMSYVEGTLLEVDVIIMHDVIISPLSGWSHIPSSCKAGVLFDDYSVPFPTATASL